MIVYNNTHLYTEDECEEFINIIGKQLIESVIEESIVDYSLSQGRNAFWNFMSEIYYNYKGKPITCDRELAHTNREITLNFFEKCYCTLYNGQKHGPEEYTTEGLHFLIHWKHNKIQSITMKIINKFDRERSTFILPDPGTYRFKDGISHGIHENTLTKQQKYFIDGTPVNITNYNSFCKREITRLKKNINITCRDLSGIISGYIFDYKNGY